MNVMTKGWATLAALLAGGLLATPTPALAANDQKDGTLHIYDQGKLFTESGADKAKSTFGNVKFDHGLTLTIDTYPSIPEDKKSGYKEENKAKFFKDWAVSLASGDKAKGIYVLVCRSPGYVEVIADKTTRERGFSNENEQKVRDLLLNSFKDAKAAKDAGKSDEEQSKVRDGGLQAAVDYVIKDLKGTTVPTNDTKHSNTTAAQKQKSNIMGWVCIGLVVLLAIWLVVGVIRALTGGGGGGGGGYGGGGGGGGGGFMTGLLGGLFGAMAGMWLYNNVFGGHSYGSDAYASDGYSSGGDTGDAPGDGDFSGDSGAGGSYDDGAGGDTGGGGDFGGGDYGGGGDFGGGGGDFGGGDF